MRAHTFAEFLEKNRSDAGVLADLELLAEENRAETEPNFPQMPAICHPIGVAATTESKDLCFDWKRTRRTSSGSWTAIGNRRALKSLQGKIWKAGFEAGELKGILFADVPAALARWTAECAVAIYSSGSVEAQRLLFGYSNYGDLTPLISGYFDTRTGAKTVSRELCGDCRRDECRSCRDHVLVRRCPRTRCGARCRVPDASRRRDGNAPVDDARGHTAINSFDGL